MSEFPWADIQAFDDWCREYAKEPTITTLNSLHLAASIMFSKLSTYTMKQNAGQMGEE